MRYRHDGIRIWIRKGFDDDCIDDAEYGRRRTDSQREHQDGREAKAGCFLKERVAYRRSCETSRSRCPVGAPGVIGASVSACRSGAM